MKAFALISEPVAALLAVGCLLMFINTRDIVHIALALLNMIVANHLGLVRMLEGKTTSLVPPQKNLPGNSVSLAARKL